MTDIDISLQSWGEQGAGLRNSGSTVREMGSTAVNTMSGNPYGVVLTPFFQAEYMELSSEFQNTNSTLGEVLEAVAQAIEDSATDFWEAEMEIKDGFDKLMNSI